MPSLLASLILVYALLCILGFLQMTVSGGWHTLFEDAKVAVQIDRYPNWQNRSQMGYPNREDGQVVTPHYERVTDDCWRKMGRGPSTRRWRASLPIFQTLTCAPKKWW